MNKFSLLLVVLTAFVLQACSQSRPALSAPASMVNQVELRTDWRRGVDGAFGEASERFNIVNEDNSLYLVTRRGIIYQLDAEDGHRIKRIKVEDTDVSAGLAKNADLAFISTYDAELIAVSLTQESEVWRKTLTSEILSEVAVVTNKLAVQTSDGWLSVLDANTGDTLWRTKESVPALSVRGTNVPIITEGKVIAGFSNGQLKAYSLLNGKSAWSFEVGKPEGKYEIERLTDVDGRLLLSDKTLFSTAYNGTISAIDVNNGDALWQRSIPSALSTAIIDDLLIVIDQESKIFALNAISGSLVWQQDQLADRDLISPVIFQNQIATIDRAGYVHILDKDTGEIIAYKLADQNLPVGSRMVSNGEQLFILTPNEHVTALTID
ncbi:outer membrane protein assembly factor BamB [Marinomonas sp. PE14-40]|uniref:outer membrane protein assembly factor BamB n=1 Tax=Marinomonas sp. PE14-40 TaxID=3060621 RepID=UPI003F67A6B6